MRKRTSRPAPVIPRPRLRPATTRAELLRRYRRPLVVACLLLAAASALNMVAEGQVGERQVVVSAGDLPAGRLLHALDLQVRSVPLDASDTQVLEDLNELVGQRLAVAVPAGTVLRDFLLVGPQLLTGAAPGTVAVPIRLSDAATVGLISPGQLVDIVLTTGDGFEQQIRSQTVARAVPVLWVPTQDAGQFGMFSGNTAGEGIIVVAAAASLSDDLAGAVSRGKVSAVLVN